MLTAELKVNGILFGVLYIHNQTGEPISEYQAVYHEIGNTIALSASFEHKRADGGLICIEKALHALKGE